MKRADAEKVRNHQVDRGGLARAPQYSGCVVRLGTRRGHALCRDYREEGVLVENEGVKLEVGVGDVALEVGS